VWRPAPHIGGNIVDDQDAQLTQVTAVQGVLLEATHLQVDGDRLLALQHKQNQ